jgi:8-oxo-dGTP diphosphatase
LSLHSHVNRIDSVPHAGVGSCILVAMASSAPRLLVVGGLVWLAPTRVLVHRRSSGAAFGAGMIELPGGKVDPGEPPAAALARELVEEWGVGARMLVVGPIADVLHHVYRPPGPEVVLLVYHVDARGWGDAWADHVESEAGVEPLAFALADLPVQQFLAADLEFAAALARGEVRSPFDP